MNTGGVPNGVAFDPNGVVYICDFAHQAVLTLGAAEDGSDQQLTAIVKDYEGKSLKVCAASRRAPAAGAAVCHHCADIVKFRALKSGSFGCLGAEQRRGGQQRDGILHRQWALWRDHDGIP